MYLDLKEKVVSHNGPQFSSEEFAEGAIDWDFEHLTSSPGNSKANGKAEAAVKVTKDLIRKTMKPKEASIWHCSIIGIHQLPGMTPA